MEEKEKSAQIEKIRQQLEKKLQEIENRKKAATLKKEIKPTKKEEKTLFELRKELQELQKTKNVMVEEKKNTEKNSITNSSQPKISENKTSAKPVSKLKNEDKSTIITPDTKEILKEKEVEIKENNKTPSKATTKKEVNPIVPLIKEKETTKPISTTNRAINKTSKQKKGTVEHNKIIFIIAFTFALLYLGYLFKLKIDLKKEKEALAKKKLEQIDYSKDDAVFKEVEEDPAPEELQDIK